MNDSRADLPTEPTGSQVIISANTGAGARSGEPAILELAGRLRSRGYDVAVHENIDTVTHEARIARANGTLRAVVAAGGDGTVSLVANRTEPGTPIAVLPLGTENLLSKYVGIGHSAEEVCDVIDAGAVAQVDVGRIDDRLFLLMFSCGFDADVVRRVHDRRDGNINQLAYLKPILDTMWTYRYPEIRIYCDDDAPIRARWGFVHNLPCYAWNLPPAPDAVGTDGLLDIAAFHHRSILQALKFVSGNALGRRDRWVSNEKKRARRIRIECDSDIPYQIDGDPGGRLPVDIQVEPALVTLMVPEATTPATL